MIFAILMPMMLAAGPETPANERTTIPLTDPTKAVHLKVHTINGGITVKGSAGKEVVVEVRSRGQGGEAGDPHRYPGMKIVPSRSSGLSIEEADNVVTVTTESWRSPVDLVIEVPTRTSVDVGCINEGDIVIDQVQGDVVAQNVNGSIQLSAISGSALANTTNGDVKAGFLALEAGRAMSFVTLNGNVEVSLPASTKADLNLGIGNEGDIYSDFPIATKAAPAAQKEAGTRGRDGRFVLKIDRAVRGTINGGGAELTLKTFNGDILLRAVK